MGEDVIIKPRKPWLAALLSLLASGLGQIYNGELKKGVLFLVLGTLLGCVFAVGVVNFTLLAVILSAVVLFSLYVAVDAFVSARRRQEYTLQRMNRVVIYVLVFTINLGLGYALDSVMTEHIYRTFKVPSESMLRTLYVGDHFIARLLADDDPVNRGDIVVFEYEDRYFVKRVIGLPGESIAMKDKDVFINGVELEETYDYHTVDLNLPERDTFAPRQLGPDEFFLMGDNRERSMDSRFIGTVRRDTIVARAEYIYFPGESPRGFDRIGMAIR